MAEEETKKTHAESSEREDSVAEESPKDGAAAQASEEEAAPADAASNSSDGADAQADGATTEQDAAGKEENAIDWKDQYARLLADFDNFKKRTMRDREETYRFAEGDIIKDILPTVDNLALALSKAEDPENQFVKGVALVYENLLKALKGHEAEPFDCVGLELDTERMEAIAHLPSEEVEEGKVSIESKRGWLLKGKVLRAAQVVVSSGKGQ